jgi:hypothetical protein
LNGFLPANIGTFVMLLMFVALVPGSSFSGVLGGIGGPQTRSFILHPTALPVPAEPIVGAEQVHAVLSEWRRVLQTEPRPSRSR